MNIDPREIKGIWENGWALDVHTISSTFDGYNEWGYKVYDTKRSDIGELLYKIKYKYDKSQINIIAQVVVDFIHSKEELKDLHAIIPVPPSDTSRSFQPVQEIAAIIGKTLDKPIPADYLHKIKYTTALKNMTDTQNRKAELEGAFKVTDYKLAGHHVLVFDDFFRSGETLNAICEVLISQGKVGKISVITVTETRAKR
jgi:competence protein ComFC